MNRCLRLLRVIVLCGATVTAGLPAGAQQPANPAVQPPAAKPQVPAQAAPPAQQPAKPAQANPAPANPAVKDPVVATINGQPIRLSELEVAQQALPPQYRNMPLSSVFPALLDRIVDSKLAVADARKNKLADDAAFKKRMAFVEDQILQDFWVQREIAKRVTAEKMQQRYQERLKSTPAEEEVRARHILVSTEDEAKTLIAELKKGGAFDKLAKEKSTDKASGAEGGDLGWFKKSDMVKEFADAAFALKKGELTDTPVKTQFGYHVIKLEDRRQAPPPTFEELSDQIREELARETVTQILDQLRAGAKIEKFNIDGSKPEPQAAKPAAPGTPAPAAPSPAAPPK